MQGPEHSEKQGLEWLVAEDLNGKEVLEGGVKQVRAEVLP